MAETRIPMILSTGMTGKKELDDALEIICKYHSNISILHCLSQYPSEYQNINLLSIQFLKENYSQFTIGYSDHSIGILMPAVAVGMGAEIIEKHITLDRTMKGTDHRGSLEPEGIWRMVRDIRNTEYAVGENAIFVSEKVKATRIKLERSVATLRNIAAGELITENDLHLLSPGDGFKWAERDRIVGKISRKAIPANEIIYPEMLER
jgi:sialic acid synthase